MTGRDELLQLEKERRDAMRALANTRLTIAEFLYLYNGVEGRWELVAGVPTMMAGGTRLHAQIAANLLVALRPKLRAQGCDAFGSDFGLKTGADTVRYPDLSIYCDRRDLDSDAEQQRYGRFPIYLFEILSESTRPMDMGAKLSEYQALESVQGVFLVDPETRMIIAFVRDPGGQWPPEPGKIGQGETIALEAVGLTLRWEDVFAT